MTCREEECTEHYEKLCYIVFSQQATTEIVQHCYRPLVRECNQVDPSGNQVFFFSSIQFLNMKRNSSADFR
jgi:endonuclease III